MLRYALTNLRANVTRLIATALAVIIGIGFLAAGLMLTDAMKDALVGNVDRQYADVDLVVTPPADVSGAASSVPVDVLDQVRAVDGVAGAAGELTGPVNLLDRSDEVVTSRTSGRAWIDVERLNPLTIDEGDAPDGAGQVVVDRGTASDQDLRIGSKVRLSTPAGPDEFEVVGISSFDGQDSVDDGGTFSFDPSTAQDVLAHESPGWNDVLIATDDGATDRVRTALRDELPGSLKVETGGAFREDQREQNAGLVDLLRPLLQGFAYLALFVAAFVIFNTFSVVVTQRFRELALIRAVGGTPAQVRRSLLLEGAVVGFVASAIGIVFGAALSFGIQAVLGAFDVKLPGAGVAVRPWTIVLCLVAGTVVTVVSVFVPAFRAGRTKPVEAMRDAAVDHSGTSKARAVIGGTCLVLSIALLLAVRVGGVTEWLLLPGALLLFVGLVVGGPLVARLFAAVLRAPARHAGLTARLAVDNTARNPKRTATTANALVIGLFLVTLVTVSGDALKQFTVEQIDKLSSSDFIVASGASGIAPDLVEQIQQTKGVADAAPVRQAVTVDPQGRIVILSGTDVDLLGRSTGLEVQQGSLEEIADGSGAGVVALPGGSGGDAGPGSDAELAEVPTRIGQSFGVVAPDGTDVEVPVVATLEPKLDTLLLGTLVSEERFTELTGDHPVTQVFVRADDDQVDAVGVRLNELVVGHAGTEVVPGNFLGQIVSQVFDFLINTVNALLGMSVVIALVGIVNTLTLSIIERRRELGMVRSLGMTRQQVGRMVRMEAVLIGVLGTVIGVGAGLLLGWVVIGSLSADIDLNVNWARIGLIALVGVLAGVLASILPARRATRVEMVEAMKST
ncbi:ABC transporter permease [Dermatobacter hominis]|uniref:ABC transporter permease n=1 Tax=Dermatobacter hominis TaxID=2884263 RepID=UPI001D11557D|nr:ABC transporter permease [Dermatobacter hominis]UDY37361.1 ABC transporter permease [Dermatobacter hominis]